MKTQGLEQRPRRIGRAQLFISSPKARTASNIQRKGGKAGQDQRGAQRCRVVPPGAHLIAARRDIYYAIFIAADRQSITHEPPILFNRPGPRSFLEIDLIELITRENWFGGFYGRLWLLLCFVKENDKRITNHSVVKYKIINVYMISIFDHPYSIRQICVLIKLLNVFMRFFLKSVLTVLYFILG